MSSENKMGVAPIPKLVLSISLPLVISMMVQSLYNIVDSIFVARLGEDALTAVSLAYPAQILLIAVSVGTGVGVNSLLSRELGKKNFEGANKVGLNGLFLAVVLSLVFTILGLFIVPSFYRIFTNDAYITGLGISYLRICMLLCSGIFLGTMGERLLQATGKTSLSMVAQTAGALTNVILDPIMIYGWIGFPKMGVAGAALATVIGQWVAAVLAIILNITKNKEISLSFKGFRPSSSTIKLIYKVGVPAMCVQALSSLMVIVMNKVLVGFSNTAVAVFGVYYKLHNFIYMPVLGLTQGLIPIIGYNYGAKNGKRVMAAWKFNTIVACAISAAGMLVFVLLPSQLMSMFNPSVEMMKMGIPALRILGLPFIFTAFSVGIGYACSGMGNGINSMVSALIRQLVVLVPCVYLLSYLFGLGGIWFAFLVAEVLAAVYAGVSFVHECRVKISY
ncbi:MAG: MATE family efflux transporter [Lachnospiraceae bacterium]|jgi:putative MATE family efflux protein|nr:MATE family efflux transporter [Lachnospiraceae bacterium]